MKIPEYYETICPLCKYYKICNKKRYIECNVSTYKYMYCEKYRRKEVLEDENNK